MIAVKNAVYLLKALSLQLSGGGDCSDRNLQRIKITDICLFTTVSNFISEFSFRMTREHKRNK